MEEANEYDETAGPATTTGEKIAGFAGSVLPELSAYAVTGNVLGAGARGLSLTARIARGTAAALPVTAALEADAKETSTAYAVGKLLGSSQLDRLSESPLGGVAVGSVLDLGGNGLGEGIGEAFRRYRAARATMPESRPEYRAWDRQRDGHEPNACRPRHRRFRRHARPESQRRGEQGCSRCGPRRSRSVSVRSLARSVRRIHNGPTRDATAGRRSAQPQRRDATLAQGAPAFDRHPAMGTRRAVV